MAISLCIKGREEMTKNIIIKTSVQKRFDSFMVHGRVLFSAHPAALERQYWRTQAAFYTHFLEPSLAPGEELTPTELQILHLLCADKSNAEIAQIMDVKLPTVKTNVSHILDKLDVKRRAEARTAAKKLNLVQDDL